MRSDGGTTMTDDGAGTRVAIWTWPVVLAVVTAVGLLSALLADGIWDVLSWVTLVIPVGVCLAYGLPWRRGDRARARRTR